jgi:hypothetical protein
LRIKEAKLKTAVLSQKKSPLSINGSANSINTLFKIGGFPGYGSNIGQSQPFN